MAMIDLRNATIYIKDGSSHSLEIAVGQGNLTYNEKRQIDMVKSRGDLDTVRENESLEMDVAFSFVWEHLKSADSEPPTIEECLKKRGPASSWVSASPDPHAPYAVNIEINYESPCTGVKDEVILFPMFNHTNLAHSLQDGTIACSGICNAVEPTIVRPT